MAFYIKLSLTYQVGVIELLGVHQFQRFQCLALDHLERGLADHFPVVNFLQQIPEGGQDDPDHLFLGAFGKNVAEHLDHALRLEELSDLAVEGEAP